ncbi:hypothetical protein Droror1_Dr00017381 [Drosera rotundifolia]
MSLIDILFRVDQICKKFEKYDIDKQRQLNANADDPFAKLYSSIESDIDAATYKAEKVAMERDRAKAVAMNAEIRRTKGRLMEEMPKLQKLACKKVKGVSKEDMETRNEMVFALADRIKAIPDGATAVAAKTSGCGASEPRTKIKFDMDEPHDDQFFQESEESRQFRQEYEMRKAKQDQGLDVISEGLDTLKSLAIDMNEELDRQVPLMDEIEEKVDKATSDLKKTNVRLKENLHQLRSNRNFCIDIVLMCVILGIVSYLYNILD